MLTLLHFLHVSWLATKLAELTIKSTTFPDFGLLDKNNLCISNCSYLVMSTIWAATI